MPPVRVADVVARGRRRHVRVVAVQPLRRRRTGRSASSTASRRAPAAGRASRPRSPWADGSPRRTRPPRLPPLHDRRPPSASGAGITSGVSRRCHTVDPFAGTLALKCSAALVPCPSGFTPRLAVDDVAVERVLDVRADARRAVQPLRVRLVVGEERPCRPPRHRGAAGRACTRTSGSAANPRSSRRRSATGSRCPTGPPVMTGCWRRSAPQPQVLRNQRCGSTCSAAACGPRLNASMRMQMSSGAAFAYSTTTSK